MAQIKLGFQIGDSIKVVPVALFDSDGIPLSGLGVPEVVFTEDGTWVVPAGVNTIYVSGCGGGGGGAGGHSADPGGGGGGGGCAVAVSRMPIRVTPGATLTITIGTGGGGGAAGVAG